MIRTLFCILIALSFCCGMTAASGVYDVRDYGAKGDGTTLDHGAINKAIEAATAGGGGQVVLSAGTYLCGSIRLKSNVDLHLMAGAKILAAPASMKAYDESESFGGFCLALKNVESKTTFKNGEKRRFRFVGATRACTESQRIQKAKDFGGKTYDCKGSFVKSCTRITIK